MIKNYKNIDYQNSLKEKIVSIEDSQLTRDQHLLNSVVGFNYMISHKQERIRSNELRWKTADVGVLLELSQLDPTASYIIPFDNEEIIGQDCDYKANDYWYFQPAISGVYRMSTNCRFELTTADEAIVKTIYTSYIPLIEECEFGFYRNGSIIQPNMVVPMSSWNPTNNDYYIGHNRTTYRFQANQDILYYLDAGDKIEVRAGFIRYVGIAAIFLTTFGDVNINYISDYQNFNRLS